MSDYIRGIFSLLSRLFTKGQVTTQKYQTEKPPSRYSKPCNDDAKVKNTDFVLCPETLDTNSPSEAPVSEYYTVGRLECTNLLKKSASDVGISRTRTEYRLLTDTSASCIAPDSRHCKSCNRPLPIQKKFELEDNQFIRHDDDEIGKATDFPKVLHTNSQNEISVSKCYTNLLKKSASDVDISRTRIKDTLFSDTSDRRVYPDFGYCKSCDRKLLTRKKFEQKDSQFIRHGQRVKLRSATSKIPVACDYKFYQGPKLNYHHRGIHTLAKPYTKENELSNALEEELFIEDSEANFKHLDIGTWLDYRCDTSTRFECVFKSFSKKKHNVGNMIDSSLHAQWMQLAGIPVDKDSFLFKQFARGKVVLNFGEYKYFLNKMCTIWDLEYWDVLRKMATVFDKKKPSEALITTS